MEEKMAEIVKGDLDQETIKTVERIIVLRIATKHINLWMRKVKMKRKAIIQLGEGLMRFDAVKKEIEGERNLERWARGSTSCFTKNVKRMLYEEIDNMVWSKDGEEITK